MKPPYGVYLQYRRIEVAKGSNGTPVMEEMLAWKKTHESTIDSDWEILRCERTMEHPIGSRAHRSLVKILQS